MPTQKADLDTCKRNFAIHECCSYFDHSMAVKMGVHYQLWGGSIMFLGTKRHHDKYVRGTENLSIVGCFSLTEVRRAWGAARGRIWLPRESFRRLGPPFSALRACR